MVLKRVRMRPQPATKRNLQVGNLIMPHTTFLGAVRVTKAPVFKKVTRWYRTREDVRVPVYKHLWAVEVVDEIGNVYTLIWENGHWDLFDAYLD